MKSDRERILDVLIAEGSITSYEIRDRHLSGNPAQRINELRADGHEIDGEPGYRLVHGRKRPETRYILISEPSPAAVRGVGPAGEPGAAQDAPGVDGSPELVAGGQVRPKTSPPSSPPPEAPTLFEVPADHQQVGHIDLDQRSAA